MLPEGAGAVTPSFSLVIPTRSRPGQLAECLRAVSRSAYPRDRLEVIVVDDGGDAPLDPIVARFQGELALTLLRQANAGPAAARNAGAEHARGEFLAFTDDDCLPEPSWLASLAEGLASAPGAMVGGATLNGVPENACSAVSQTIVDAVYRHYNADPRRARFLASNNLALPARGFREVGGFDPTFRTAEDRDLCDRWRYQGRPMVYHPGARVWHARTHDVRSFCRQHFQYGRGAERFQRARAGRESGGMLAEFRFHLNVGNWLLGPLRAVPRRQAPAVAALLAIWQTANFAGFLWERVRRTTGMLRDGTQSFLR